MFSKSSSNSSKKSTPFYQKNPLETFKDLERNSAPPAKKSSSGAGIFDGIFGTSDYQPASENFGFPQAEHKQQPARREFSLFKYQEYYEDTIVKRKIKELTELLTKEIEYLKRADASMRAEVKEIEALTLQASPDKPGIYHVRFLEIVLQILRSLREKIGESRTWLQAMVSKKKKRGSLFSVRSKQKGTQYSLSQELQSARSIQ